MYILFEKKRNEYLLSFEKDLNDYGFLFFQDMVLDIIDDIKINKKDEDGNNILLKSLIENSDLFNFGK